jgi:predicted ATPase
MLTKIEIENFKSFIKVMLELKQLTVLTGLNNSGKSSVIQAINMMFGYYLSGKQKISLSDHVSPRLQKSILSKDNFFTINIHTEKGNKFSLKVNNDGDSFSFNVNENIMPTFSMQYISASRLGPQNVLGLNPEFIIPEIGIKGEYIIDFIDKNQDLEIHEALIRDKDSISRLKENINAWLQYISPGTELSYDIMRGQNASYPYYNKFLPTEAGYGLSYTLPIITALLIPSKPEGSILLIENPEAHLHPQGQTAIGKLIALTASTGKQVIVETHSDHLIDGIRIMAKQKKLNTDDVTFHYFSRKDYGSETKVETPVLKEDGKLSFWPQGFFDQGVLNKAELLKNDI